MSRARIAVLASGGGSNLQALIDHFSTLGASRAGDIVLVTSNQARAGALERAAKAGIATDVLANDGADLGDRLAAHRIDLVVLAGYLKLIPADVTMRFTGRMINVHPAPLPAFGGAGMYGLHAHRAVLASGVSMSGPTVHFVDEVFDHGAIIAHWPVPVVQGDDEHSLSARVLRAEHLLFPRAVQAVASGAISLSDSGRPSAPLFDSPLEPFDEARSDVALAARLDALRANHSSAQT